MSKDSLILAKEKTSGSSSLQPLIFWVTARVRPSGGSEFSSKFQVVFFPAENFLSFGRGAAEFPTFCVHLAGVQGFRYLPETEKFELVSRERRVWFEVKDGEIGPKLLDAVTSKLEALGNFAGFRAEPPAAMLRYRARAYFEAPNPHRAAKLAGRPGLGFLASAEISRRALLVKARLGVEAKRVALVGVLSRPLVAWESEAPGGFARLAGDKLDFARLPPWLAADSLVAVDLAGSSPAESETLPMEWFGGAKLLEAGPGVGLAKSGEPLRLMTKTAGDALRVLSFVGECVRNRRVDARGGGGPRAVECFFLPPSPPAFEPLLAALLGEEPSLSGLSELAGQLLAFASALGGPEILTRLGLALQAVDRVYHNKFVSAVEKGLDDPITTLPSLIEAAKGHLKIIESWGVENPLLARTRAAAVRLLAKACGTVAIRRLHRALTNLADQHLSIPVPKNPSTLTDKNPSTQTYKDPSTLVLKEPLTLAEVFSEAARPLRGLANSDRCTAISGLAVLARLGLALESPGFISTFSHSKSPLSSRLAGISSASKAAEKAASEFAVHGLDTVVRVTVNRIRAALEAASAAAVDLEISSAERRVANRMIGIFPQGLDVGLLDFFKKELKEIKSLGTEAADRLAAGFAKGACLALARAPPAINERAEIGALIAKFENLFDEAGAAGGARLLSAIAAIFGGPRPVGGEMNAGLLGGLGGLSLIPEVSSALLAFAALDAPIFARLNRHLYEVVDSQTRADLLADSRRRRRRKIGAFAQALRALARLLRGLRRARRVLPLPAAPTRGPGPLPRKLSSIDLEDRDFNGTFELEWDPPCLRLTQAGKLKRQLDPLGLVISEPRPSGVNKIDFDLKPVGGVPIHVRGAQASLCSELKALVDDVKAAEGSLRLAKKIVVFLPPDAHPRTASLLGRVEEMKFEIEVEGTEEVKEFFANKGRVFELVPVSSKGLNTYSPLTITTHKIHTTPSNGLNTHHQQPLNPSISHHEFPRKLLKNESRPSRSSSRVKHFRELDNSANVLSDSVVVSELLSTPAESDPDSSLSGSINQLSVEKKLAARTVFFGSLQKIKGKFRSEHF